MGQKSHACGLRLGINRTWSSRWYAKGGQYVDLLREDMALRSFLSKRLRQAGLARIVIERPSKKARITVYASRPGLIIGKQGADIKKLREELSRMSSDEVSFNVIEVRKPEIDATLIADNIAQQLARRVSFRRAMKRAVQNAMKSGALGIRVNCSGRLGGAEIARMEWYREGRVPLQTLRANVDFGRVTAYTTYGTCGIKVWVYMGDIMEHDPMASEKKLEEMSGRLGN